MTTKQTEARLFEDSIAIRARHGEMAPISPMLRWLLIIVGTLAVGLGIVGIVLPMLPTTPFLLLAATCYSRSSQRFYEWLLSNRYFGTYIRNYREGRGLTLATKIVSVSSIWATIGYTSFWIIDIWPLRLLLLSIAVAVTVHLLSVKTFRK